MNLVKVNPVNGLIKGHASQTFLRGFTDRRLLHAVLFWMLSGDAMMRRLFTRKFARKLKTFALRVFFVCDFLQVHPDRKNENQDEIHPGQPRRNKLSALVAEE